MEEKEWVKAMPALLTDGYAMTLTWIFFVILMVIAAFINCGRRSSSPRQNQAETANQSRATKSSLKPFAKSRANGPTWRPPACPFFFNSSVNG
ncbi:MAG: hypothetical protein ACXVZT_05705 [Terriglobales bacterium]